MVNKTLAISHKASSGQQKKKKKLERSPFSFLFTHTFPPFGNASSISTVPR
jgi:hypothetical protein